MTKLAEPITFTEPCWLILDVDKNAVLMTEHGNLAIFNTQIMAELWAKRSLTRKLEVVTVRVTRITSKQ